MPQRLVLLKLVLGWICAGHILIGLLAFISGEAGIRFGSLLYGADFQPAPQFEYTVRPIGAYMLGFAFLQVMAIRDPWRYRAVIDATIFVFILRQFQRILYAPDIFAAFGIAPSRHWTTTVYMLSLAALLLVARLSMQAAPSAVGTAPQFGRKP